MEPLTLKPRAVLETEEIESWDDDDFDNLDDIHIRSASTATSIISCHPVNARDSSVSSRLSLRSESNHGDESWDVLVDGQTPLKDAISIAKSKGIPIPASVPRSALEGGTIRRLRGKEIKKAIADDWSEDLDLTSAAPLKLARPEERDLSESLRQISAAFHSSPLTSPDQNKFTTETIKSPKARIAPAPITLDAFRDDEGDRFDDVPTIRVAKHRSPTKPILLSSPSPAPKPENEGLEDGFELPSDGQLRLPTRKAAPQTPQQDDDFDIESMEGSIGIRHAGPKRSGRSNRSSSVSAISPSVSSAITVESEDEGLNGLVLPEGPIEFEAKLRRRQESRSPETSKISAKASKRNPTKDDFFADLDIGEGDVFDAAKLSLNRNIKHKIQRPASPSKRTATILNFTSTKSSSTISRLPRFQTGQDRHDRSRSHLEPVSETGAPIPRYQRPTSRLGQNVQNANATSNIPTPSTPSRRNIRSVESRNEMGYNAPTTTGAQLLRARRSMTGMRTLQSPTKQSTYPRPNSRQDSNGNRITFSSRPKSPADRADSRLSSERKPFLPVGASANQSQHVSTKSSGSRHSRRTDSNGSNDGLSAAQKSLAKLIGHPRPETPGKSRNSLTPAELAAQAKKTMTRPARKQNFGDGSELEIFDDLPTSAATEQKFIKAPIGRGAPRSLRSRIGQGSTTTSLSQVRAGSETPVPTTPVTPLKQEFNLSSTNLGGQNLPRFAQPTQASQAARAQRQISTAHNHHVSSSTQQPLQPVSANTWKGQLPFRQPPSLRKRSSKPTQNKPHLIKPMGSDHQRTKSEKGMEYNPTTFRWEGNENSLAPFEVPDFHPRPLSPPVADEMTESLAKTSPSGKANVALITNVGSSVSGVQVVGGMVFDPRRMCWLKVAEGSSTGDLRGGMDSVQLEEEEDVFAGLEDLKEEDERSSIFSGPSARRAGGSGFGGHHSGAPSDRAPASSITTGERNVSLNSVTSPSIGGIAPETPASSTSNLNLPSTAVTPVGNQDDEFDAGLQEGHSSGDEAFGFGIGEEFDVGPEFVRRQRSEEERWRRKVEKWLRVPAVQVGDFDCLPVVTRASPLLADESTNEKEDWRWALREMVLGGSL